MACTAEHSEFLLSQRPLLDSSLEQLLSDDILKAESACNTYCVTLDEYLEISTLLDPILPSHTEKLCDFIISRLTKYMSEDTTTRESSFHRQLAIELPCRAVYTLSKVRLVKPFCTHLPHQVHHLRFLLPALIFAEKHLRSNRSWQVRYVLFVWSSVAIRVPFPLDTIFPDDVISSAVVVARRALMEPSRISDVAAAFLARLLARRDASDLRASLINSAVSDVRGPSVSSDVRAAYLALLAATFKHAHRDDLVPFIQPVLSMLDNLQPETLVESHRLCKLAHRVALSFLPPRTASWRYSRPTSQMFVNDDSKSTTDFSAGHVGHLDDGDGGMIPLSDRDAERLEAIIDLLFNALRYRDTVVRYSAAKGIARISARLPLLLARDVADSLLDLFVDRDEARADAAAHGGCIAVAELARRGLILPADEQFARMLHAVRDAARFDLRRGASSVGAQVRDAACYAVWAVARAYERDHVAPYGAIITEAMLPVALLDREVNCRRAAAAALQECVGRLADDVFPEGIKLITMADYFSIGDRNVAYLDVTRQVAQLGDGVYFSCILEELWKRKLFHWDANVRVLAAKALAVIIDFDVKGEIVQNVLPQLVPMATKRGDVVFRHGAVLGLSEIAPKLGYKRLGSQAEALRHIPMLLKSTGLFSGRSGDEMRVASCHLIRSLAKGAPEIFLIDENARLDTEKSLEILERLLGSGKEKLYAEATSAYEAICRDVIASDVNWHMRVTRRVLNGMCESRLTELQRGFALAAGACGESEISREVISTLCNAVRTNGDVEVRRNACTSLAKVLVSGLRDTAIEVLNALADGMQDYANDDRGDIGSWVREASMLSFSILAAFLFEQDDIANVEELEDALIMGIREVIRECCGRIDRTRVVAGKALKRICFIFSNVDLSFERMNRLCTSLNEIFHFRHDAVAHQEMDNPPEANFAGSEVLFPVMREVLHLSEVRSAVLRGFVSAGSGTRSQYKAPCAALNEFFRSLNDCEEKGVIFESGILKVVKDRNERDTISALNVLSELCRLGTFSDFKLGLLLDITRAIRASWRGRARDVKLLMTGMSALDELVCLSVDKDGKFALGEGSLASECLEAMVIVLGGAIPRLRRFASESIYVALTLCDVDGFEGGCGDGVFSAMDILLDNTWDVIQVADARAKRDDICHHLGIRAPVAAGKR